MIEPKRGQSTEGFLPTLLDRLMSAPGSGSGTLSRSEYQKTVLRDLHWLLGSTTSIDAKCLERFPLTRDSVINYGVPCVTGASLTESELDVLAAEIEQAILLFEPRILPGSLSVMPHPDQDAAIRNQLVFSIRMAFWFEPYPLELAIRAQWDVDNGLVNLRED